MWRTGLVCGVVGDDREDSPAATAADLKSPSQPLNAASAAIYTSAAPYPFEKA